MEAAGGVADLLRETCFDVHVHVFEVVAQHEVAARVLLENLGEPADDGIGILAGDDALAAKHAGVCNRGGDVVRDEACVEIDGGRKRFDGRRR